MAPLNVIAQLLLIIGGLNWGLVGLFNFDLVAELFGGTVGVHSTLTRAVYVVVALAALYGFALLGPLSGSTTPDFRNTRA